MALPCIPENSAAKAIAQSCDDNWPTSNDDCNHFVKNALGGFLPTGYFDGMNADEIVAKMKTAGEGWTKTTAIADAIAGAKNGKIVIAGMSSKELHDSNGHLAVIVGCDGQLSGDGHVSVIVPLCYAGSLHNASARIRGGRLSGTFDQVLVRSERINYFLKSP